MIEFTRRQVIARLKDQIGEQLAQVEAVPDRVDAWQFSHNLAAILVQYPGSTFQQRGAGQLQRKIVIDVYVLTRHLAGASGADHYIDLVTRALFRYKPGDGFSGLLPVRDRLVDVSNIRWQYVVTFECITPFYGQVL
ncbi:MAG: Gp37 family protein [Bacteroidota bacterium]|nr:Gp37 family protein [Bacteroidota bacterium]